jgi:glycosyltransferase involved in cell wall biosynthesis
MHPTAVKKKILFLAPALYPCAFGGMEIFNSALIREIGKQQDCLLLTACSRFSAPNIQKIIINKRLLGIRRFGVGTFFEIIQSMYQLIKFRRHIRLIHASYTARSGYLGLYLPWLCKFLKIKYILTLHGGGMKKPWPYGLHLCLFKHAAHLIAVSPVMQEEYQKRTGRSIEFIPPLIPFTPATRSPEEIKNAYRLPVAAKIILFVGSLKAIKGPDIVLRAFQNLREEFIQQQQLYLLFCGEGLLKNQLIHEISPGPMKDHIRFLGNIPHENIPDLYKISTALVMASAFEGTPLALIEGLFNGLPVIASDVTGLNSIIRHPINGLLFQRTEVSQLTDLIQTVFTNHDLREQLARAARKTFIDHFQFEKVKNAYITIYEQV